MKWRGKMMSYIDSVPEVIVDHARAARDNFVGLPPNCTKTISEGLSFGRGYLYGWIFKNDNNDSNFLKGFLEGWNYGNNS